MTSNYGRLSDSMSSGSGGDALDFVNLSRPFLCRDVRYGWRPNFFVNEPPRNLGISDYDFPWAFFAGAIWCEFDILAISLGLSEQYTSGFLSLLLRYFTEIN